MTKLQDINEAVTRLRSVFGNSAEDFKKWIETDPVITTEAGYTFKGNPESLKSFALGDPNSKYAEISTRLTVPGGVRTEIPRRIAHEAQHLIDQHGRDPETLSAMQKDYKTGKKKYGDKFHSQHHSELRAFARELATVMRLAYDREKPEGVSFLEYAFDKLKTVGTGMKDNRVAQYVYQFLQDEEGKKIGIEDLPSDERLKIIDDACYSGRFDERWADLL